MIDVCTLVISSVMTLEGCLMQPQCHNSWNNNEVKTYCIPQACPIKQPKQWYECKKEDGSIYIEPYEPK